MENIPIAKNIPLSQKISIINISSQSEKVLCCDETFEDDIRNKTENIDSLSKDPDACVDSNDGENENLSGNINDKNDNVRNFLKFPSLVLTSKIELCSAPDITHRVNSPLPSLHPSHSSFRSPSVSPFLSSSSTPSFFPSISSLPVRESNQTSIKSDIACYHYEVGLKERDATTDKIDNTRKGEESDSREIVKEEDIIAAAPPILRELKSMTITARKDNFTIDHNKIDDNTEDYPIENNIFPLKSSNEIPSQKELFHTNSAEDINECDG